jgi:peptide/nickel transport system permease protein
LSGVVGAVIGVFAAQFRAFDAPVMRLMDAMMSFPAILLALGITAALGPRMESVIIALSVAYVPAGVRIVRASALVVRELDYVQAARIAGASNARIMFHHILPNSFGPLLVHMTFVFAYSILAEAALSFLGVGVQPPTPSWGNIIAEGRDFATEAWWIMVFPGIGISLAALGLNLLGDGLRDVLDPRLKGA